MFSAKSIITEKAFFPCRTRLDTHWLKGKHMKKYFPLLGGVLAIIIVFYLPMKTKFLTIQAILVAIPLITYQLRDKDADDRPYQGGLLGGVIGAFVGALLDCIVLNLISDDTAKYSIRLDIILSGILGASIGSTLGIIAGGRFKQSVSVLGWKCPECGIMNREDIATCSCGHDSNR